MPVSLGWLAFTWLRVLADASITQILSFPGSGVRLGTQGMTGTTAPPPQGSKDHFLLPVSPVDGETLLDLCQAYYLYPPVASADSSWPGRGGQGASALGQGRRAHQLTHLCVHPQLYPQESGAVLGTGRGKEGPQSLLHKQQNKQNLCPGVLAGETHNTKDK